MTRPYLLRPALLQAARSPRIQRLITRVPATKNVVKRFVAGETEDDAVAAAKTVLHTGRSITIDYLGEDTTNLEQANRTVTQYLSLLSSLTQLVASDNEGGQRHRLEFSLKLSALGQLLPGDGEKVALANVHKICAAAEEAGVWVTVDAEDHTTTDSTLAIVRAARQDFPTLGTVLQAYLKRTEADCKDLAGPGSRIRLCKGAYNEPASVAYQSKIEVDEAYVRCMVTLMSGSGYPMVASHDPRMIEAALHNAAINGRTAEEFELQMLYGIRDAEQLRLAREHQHVRVYLPYGDEWYGYFMRRLAERPANLTLFLRALATRQ
ncbi:proline dehydrogenase family protein [Nocardia sp. NPDC059239]|uniref:proline dehydrogenase family protein n=1 Tax=Nocardia sp. NPDC059239 TaxID=3346785 RepID=UPI00369DEC2A